jgi:hypothetical protein
MKFHELSVAALASQVRRHYPLHVEGVSAGREFIQTLNRIVWGLNWIDLFQRFTYGEKPDQRLPNALIDICRDCAELANAAEGEVLQVGCIVPEGDLKGHYVYDTERSILSVHLPHDGTYFVYLVDDLTAGLIEREPDSEVFEVLG